MSTNSFVEAIAALKNSKPVVFPTDTVYGLGVAVKYSASPRAIYEIKERDAGKPIAWLVENPAALDEYGVDVPEKVRQQVETHWPGALTVIVKASDKVPPAFRAIDGTIGLRMPANETALRLIRVVGPIATSSANLSGDDSPCSADELDPELAEKVAVVITDDQVGSGMASTVLDCSKGKLVVIRQGEVRGESREEPSEKPDKADGKGETGEPGEPGKSGEAEQAGETGEIAAPAPSPAEDGVFTVPFQFVSHSKKAMVNAKLWTSATFGGPNDIGTEDPKAVIQIVHGMAEHIDRYDDLARYLVKRGFVVCAEDHVGHGGTATGPEDYGHIPLRNGKNIVVGDVHTLHRMVARTFPGVPYVLYGHSMGSFIARAYIARYGDELDACVLSGTGNVAEGLSKSGRSLARFIASIRGERHRSKLIDNMGAGAYGKKIKNRRTKLDWLSTDPEVVDAYIADEKCGFMFTVGGYSTLLDLTAEVVTPECASKVPKDLPVFFVAGDGDPVGDMGEGVKAAAQLLRSVGVKTVDCKLYEGMRHEIHNEIDKEQVYDDIATWIEEHV